MAFSVHCFCGGLEEEARRGLHLAIRLCIRNLAEPGGCSEGRCGWYFGIRSYCERTAWRLEVRVIDDIEGVDTELELQPSIDLEVLGD